LGIDDFIIKFKSIFEDGEKLVIAPHTEFRALEDWDSLAALGFITMMDAEYDVKITANEIKAAKTIQELFQLAEAKTHRP